MGFGAGGGSAAAAGPQDNQTAITDPTVNDDNTLGYSLFSRWLNTATTEMFICMDATTGAAHWESITLTIEDLGSMATQSSTNVAITGGTISGVALTPTAITLPVVEVTASTGSTSITAGSNTLLVLKGVTTHTFVLPAYATAADIGKRYRVKNYSTGALTIARAGSDTIEGATSFVMASGDFFEFEIAEANLWLVRY